MLATSSISLERDIEVDTFVKELVQYAIKDFFSFLEYCPTSILKGRSFVSIVVLLNHHVTVIESIGGKEKAAPYKIIMAQLQDYVEALSNIYSTNNLKWLKPLLKDY